MLGILCLSVFVIIVDGTIVNVALPTLVRELGATTSQLQWIVDAYTLVFAGLLLAAGSLGDRFGRKGVLLIGLAWFGAFSALGAFAGVADALIAPRALMGVGAALIFPATLAILVNVFTEPAERARGDRHLGGDGGPRGRARPGHRRLPARALLVGLGVPRQRAGRHRRRSCSSAASCRRLADRDAPRFDPLGMVLSIAGVVAARVGDHRGARTTAGRRRRPRRLRRRRLAARPCSCSWERRSDAPDARRPHLQQRRFTAASLVVTVAFFALFGFVFMVTQYFQFVRGYGTLASGRAHGAVRGVHRRRRAALGPRSSRRFGTQAGRCRRAGRDGRSGSSSPRSAAVDAPYVGIVVGDGRHGRRARPRHRPATESIMGSLPADKAGVGSAVNDTTRELGGTLGVAVVGSLFSSVYGGRLADLLGGTPVPSDALHAAQDSVGAAVVVAKRAGEQAGPSAGAAVKGAIDTAFMDGFRVGSLVAAGVVLVGALLAARFLPARGEPEAHAPDDCAELFTDDSRGGQPALATAAMRVTPIRTLLESTASST